MPFADRQSWKTLPKPEQSARLEYEARFTDAELGDITKGIIPMAMEDKWFIFCEEDWVLFHRSWSGALIYWIRLEEVSAGVNRIGEAWVNRDPEQYKLNDDYYDIQLLDFLIRRTLLGQDIPFPVPKGASKYKAGVVQHNIAGTGCSEKLVKKRWWCFWEK